MKWRNAASAAILTALLFFSCLSAAEAKDNKKDVILSTVGINEDYEVLGLVSYRSNDLEPAKLHNALRKKAKRMGADYVIGIRYYSNAGYVYGTGTAVKVKE